MRSYIVRHATTPAPVLTSCDVTDRERRKNDRGAGAWIDREMERRRRAYDDVLLRRLTLIVIVTVSIVAVPSTAAGVRLISQGLFYY